MATLGKRKERDHDNTTHGSTLFISNLPYTATSTDLQTLFSDIAPVRSAFVVLEHGTGISKGVGYVSFAIKEDAQNAFEVVEKNGIELNGRKLRVGWADSKPKNSESVKKDSRPPPRSTHPRPTTDPDAIRTIVISGLPSFVDSKTLWKKFRKYNGAEKLEWPLKNESGEEDQSTAHVLFNTSPMAQEAVHKLHAHVYKGSLLSVTLKKRLEKNTHTSSSLSKPKAPNRASRLIIRNLPFNITLQDLRAIFLPYGPIHSVHIPQTQGSDGKETGKGFAFVWYLSKKDAEKALEGANGVSVRAGIAGELVEGKQKRKKTMREERKAKAKAKAKEVDEVDGDINVEQEGKEVDVGERMIAVDWALSKEKWKEEQAKMDVDVDDEAEEEGEKRDSSHSDSDSGSEDEDSEALGVHEDESDSNEDVETEEPVKPSLPPPESGTTLFIRNLPFLATEDELRTLFRSFGPLRYARITLDHESGRSRGTGFACFWNKSDADKVVEQSELLKVEMTGIDTQPKKNPFTLPSILTPDPSSTLAHNLVLHGRTLDVTRAVTRDEAGKLKEEGERRREKADKRNLYLLREGVIMPNTPAAVSLTPAEVERRTSSFNARRALLRSNPSLFISKTRLSIRQIPIFVTERVLKRLAIHAVRAFEDEVKKGTRTALTRDELLEADEEQDPVNAVEEKADMLKAGKKSQKSGRGTGIKQAKIVRDQGRVDPVTGKGRSKGYGFVEMLKHADALRVLRWTNNNPDIGPLCDQWWKDELKDLIKQEKAKPEKERDEARLKRMTNDLEKTGPLGNNAKRTLIAEFSIENVQVVQRRSAQQKERVASAKELKIPREKIALKKSKMEEPPAKKRRTST